MSLSESDCLHVCGWVCVYRTGMEASTTREGGGRVHTSESNDRAALVKEAHSTPQWAVSILIWAVIYL